MHSLVSQSDGMFGCCPYPNAVCCSDGYTCCPSGTTCQLERGAGSWAVVNKCVATDSSRTATASGVSEGFDQPPPPPPSDPDAGLSAQVCKTGGPIPFSTTKKNVIIMGDSVSIGYAPFVQKALEDVAFVQHSPWGGDGGAEETEYGWRCIEYLLRAPDGTLQQPDVLYFNWGLHNLAIVPNSTLPGNVIVPGQSGPASAYAPYLLKIANRLKNVGGSTKLIFGITSPMLNSAVTDAVVQKLNVQAASLMASLNIETVDMHKAITDKCGKAPQASCFNSTGCFSPHCPANGGVGYAWLANTTVAPAIRKLL